MKFLSKVVTIDSRKKVRFDYINNYKHNKSANF